MSFRIQKNQWTPPPTPSRFALVHNNFMPSKNVPLFAPLDHDPFRMTIICNCRSLIKCMNAIFYSKDMTILVILIVWSVSRVCRQKGSMFEEATVVSHLARVHVPGLIIVRSGEDGKKSRIIAGKKFFAHPSTLAIDYVMYAIRVGTPRVAHALSNNEIRKINSRKLHAKPTYFPRRPSVHYGIGK